MTALSLLLLLIASVSAIPLDKRNNYGTSGKNGACASEVQECSDIGVDTLKKGGNAVDAIISTSLCVGVIAAYHSGLGGGGFGIIRHQTEEGHDYSMIDFRETMPAAGNETMYVTEEGSNQTLSTIGGLAVGVPGELRGFETMHNAYGKLGWTELFQPAIKLARNGFKVNADLARYIQQGSGFIGNTSYWNETYFVNGKLALQGDVIYSKRLANTLEQISWYGPKAFYSGPIANNTVKAVQSTGGILTNEDLEGYEAIVREPTNITYRGQRIFSTVAPSSGNVVLSALKIFEGFPGNAPDSSPVINVTTHRLVEAIRFAYGQRTTYGDPAFTTNVTELERLYLTDAVVEANRKKIVDNATFPVDYYSPTDLDLTATREGGTSHITCVDKAGGAVSLTTTVNLIWGSRLMTSDGVVLNNEMDDFSSPGQTNAFGFAASPINFIRPGKRPQSSISSSIAEDLETGDITISTGSAGGSRIITTTLQHLYHYIDQGLTANETVYHPRLHDQLSGKTFFEYNSPQYGLTGYSNATTAYMASLGYNVTFEAPASSGHVIGKRDGILSAAGDPRQFASRGSAF